MTQFGYPAWLIGSRSSSCPGGGECLRQIAESVGTNAATLLHDPRPFIRKLNGGAGRTRAAGGKVDLPTRDHFAGWSARLLSEEAPLRYLTGTRQIDLALIRKHLIGLGEEPGGRSALTFPMFDAGGAIVAAKWRFPRDGLQMRSWPGNGRPWPLYPPVERGWPWVLLVAGELDALRARMAGLPAVSVTCGAGTWRDEWTQELRGRPVVLCFDNNEQTQAHRRTIELNAAGVETVRLDLRRLGLRTAKGDLSDYLNAGGSPARLARTATARRAG